MTEPVYIYDALRTPRGKGKKDGALHVRKPVSLISNLLLHINSKLKLPTGTIDDVILGCVSAVGEQGANMAKTASLLAELGDDIPGFTLNRFCASGLEAVNLASAKIASRYDDFILAGGVESMSHVPMGADGGAWAMDPECNIASNFVPQGISADLIATIEGFSRQQLDEYAVMSHQRAAQAWKEQRFEKSVVAEYDLTGKMLLERDETIRPDSSVAGLKELKSAFAVIGAYGFDDVALQKYHYIEMIAHQHTAGNSSGIVDGAAIVALGNKAAGEKLRLKPRARVVSVGTVSTEPTIMLTGPAPAARKALEKASLSIDDIDLFEVNEAFAAVVLKFLKDTGVSHSKVNVNGGAIAMGHPLGATGAMILGTLLDELERQEKRLGLATLCVGGGMGVATIIERVNAY